MGRPIIIEDWAAAESKDPPEELIALLVGKAGYVLAWEAVELPGRKWSKRAKARNRVRRLRRRMRKKYPLFARQAIRETISKNPAYYRAEDPVFDDEDVRV